MHTVCGAPLTSLEQVDGAGNTYRLSPLQLNKVFERTKKELYGQRLVRLEAGVQSLGGTFDEAFSPQLKWNYVPREKEKRFQRQTALNLEHGNLLISISAPDLLPDKKGKQTEDNVAGWVGRPLDVIRAERHFESRTGELTWGATFHSKKMRFQMEPSVSHFWGPKRKMGGLDHGGGRREGHRAEGEATGQKTEGRWCRGKACRAPSQPW